MELPGTGGFGGLFKIVYHASSPMKAIAAAAPEGRVLVFGSFHAAAAGLAVLEGGDDGRG